MELVSTQRQKEKKKEEELQLLVWLRVENGSKVTEYT